MPVDVREKKKNSAVAY